MRSMRYCPKMKKLSLHHLNQFICTTKAISALLAHLHSVGDQYMIVLLGLLYQVVEILPAGDHGQGTNNLSADNQDQTSGTKWDAVHKGKECKSNPKFNPRYQRGRGICHALIDDKGVCRRYRGVI